MDTLGRHVIAELDGCTSATLGNTDRIRELLRNAAAAAAATLIRDEVFQFRGGGVSGFALLAESHVSIHTWPEHNYAAVDIYTCGVHTQPEAACHYLAEHLGATGLKMSAIERGRPAAAGGHEHGPLSMPSTLMKSAVLVRHGTAMRIDPAHTPPAAHAPAPTRTMANTTCNR